MEQCRDLTDINDKLTIITSNFSILYNDKDPIKTRVINPFKSPCFNNKVKRTTRLRNGGYKIGWRYFSAPNWEVFRKHRNWSHIITKQMKSRYFSRTLDTTLRIKALWKNLQTIGVRARQPVCDIDPNILNDYFLHSNYVAGNYSFIDIQGSLYRHSGAFQFRAFTMDELWKAVYSIKSTSVGYDNIGIKFSELVLPAVVSSLTNALNHIIISCIFSDFGKMAIIILIAKQAAPVSPGDYCRISILSTPSKAFQRLVTDQIALHFCSKNLLSEVQSGYKPSHNWSTVILKSRVRKGELHEPGYDWFF